MPSGIWALRLTSWASVRMPVHLVEAVPMLVSPVVCYLIVVVDCLIAFVVWESWDSMDSSLRMNCFDQDNECVKLWLGVSSRDDQ
jgi:hypothetical protein